MSVILRHICRAAASVALLYLLNVPLFLSNPLHLPLLFVLGVSSYHVAFLGLYSLWGWGLLGGALLLGLVHPAAGVAAGFFGGFVAAAALGGGLRGRLLSLALYLLLYAALTNLLLLVSPLAPYALEREDVPDPLHAPWYFLYYFAYHLAYGRFVKPFPLWTRWEKFKKA